jgi:hypothetical protein
LARTFSTYPFCCSTLTIFRSRSFSASPIDAHANFCASNCFFSLSFLSLVRSWYASSFSLTSPEACHASQTDRSNKRKPSEPLKISVSVETLRLNE